MARLLWVVLVLFSFASRSQATSDDEQAKLKSLMHFFSSKIAQLRPYLLSEQKFSSPEAQKEIKQALDELVKRTEDVAAPEKIDKTPGFHITYGILADHFKRTRDVFAHGQMEYARARLSGTTNLCVTCHTQIPEKQNSFAMGGFDKDLDAVTFENAEFQFITRRFDQALEKFDQLARQYPKSKLPSDQLSQLYRRKIAIFARVKRDPDMAIANLQLDLANPNLPRDVQQNIKSWIEYFKAWKNETVNPATLNDDALIEFADKNISASPERKIAAADPGVVKDLRISGLLYERLMKNPQSPRVPDMLFYLGVCERNIGSTYWYSLNDIYWKNCIEKYPKKPITRKCFDAYEASILSRFNSTPPPWARTSVEALREYL